MLFNKNRNRPADQRYTLDEYCNSVRCQYYSTKPEATPVELQAAVATAEDLRERQAYDVMPQPAGQLSAWEMACYLVARKAQDIVDSEQDEDDEGARHTRESLGAGFEHWSDD